MAVRNPPSWLQAGTHPAENDRLLIAGLLGYDLSTTGVRGGVTTIGHLAVTQNGTPNMSVNVAAGHAFVRGSQSAAQGVYHVVNDATVNLPITTADATNPRRDLVILQVRDSAYSGSSDDARLFVVTGNPASSPSDPSLASYPNSLVLARITVGAGVTSITSANIADLRPQVRPWGSQWGRIARVTRSSVFATAVAADVPQLSTTINPVPGRSYRAVVSIPRAQITAPGESHIVLNHDTSPLASAAIAGSGNDIWPVTLEGTWDATSSATVTIKTSIYPQTGSPSTNVNSASGAPMVLSVYDVGPT